MLLAQICVSLSAGDTFEGKNCKILLVIRMQMLTINGSLNAIYYLLNLYISCSVYYWNHKRSKSENKCSSQQQGYFFICLLIFDYKVQLCFFYLKDRTCLRIAIPIYCFNIFGSIFCVLFCLLIKKLILGCKTI